MPASSRVALCEPPAAVPSASAQPTPTSAPANAASGTIPNGPSCLRRRVRDDQGGAQAGARGGAEQVGIGQRVAEDALEGRAGDGQAGPDEDGEQHPGEAELQQHRRPGGVEAAGHVPGAERPSRPGRAG